jgi:hypothetical protein
VEDRNHSLGNFANVAIIHLYLGNMTLELAVSILGLNGLLLSYLGQEALSSRLGKKRLT